MSLLPGAVRREAFARASAFRGEFYECLTARRDELFELVDAVLCGTTFDIIGSVGIAILVIVGATVAMDRLPRLRRLAKPVIAVGTMSLTAYVGHFLAQTALSTPAGTGTQQSWLPLIMYVLAAILFAAIWSRFFRRGPLEYLLNAATKPAKHIR
ncbi:DUF418 domain-containing protein [Streptomyces achromogenes]|uniref:DUF418 domain-containing protein n=1 Tax=Streptomyces achromogenes TaxID=67255 RepID=UPI0035900051